MSSEAGSIFAPTPEHQQLREVMRKWTEENVDPQALEYNREEKFNRELFKRAGDELGILGITVDPEFGGAGVCVCDVTVHARRH